METTDSTSSSANSRALVPVLSYGGEFTPAPRKRFEETIVFAPFFRGRKHQLRRHVEFVSGLGYDSVVFDLKGTIDQEMFSAQAGFGMKHIWADQIEMILNEVPGRKIVYAFSNPSGSAIEAIARRRAGDIAGLICDSGPSNDLMASMVNYYKYEEPIKLLPLRWAAALSGTLLWNPRFNEAMREDLSSLPAHFKILSIRGWKDPLIPPDQIDAVFEPHHQIEWSKLSLPKAVHLNGLKDFRNEYTPGVTQFLERISTSL